MTASLICSRLHIFQQLLNALHLELAGQLQNMSLYKSVHHSYDFITLDLKTQENQLYSRITLELKNSGITINEIYCSDLSQIMTIDIFIKNRPEIIHYEQSSVPLFPFSEKTLRYLEIADSIASRAHNCTSGDNYRPGYFSKVSIDEEKIVLSQINYMNSKSLAHKNNYSLRKLEFIIPMGTAGKKTGLYIDTIGEMQIEFSDNSSENNKQCGNAILQQIELEKAVYLN